MRNYLMILLILFGSLKLCDASTMPSDDEHYLYAFIIQLLYGLDDFKKLLLDNKKTIDEKGSGTAVAVLAQIFDVMERSSKEGDFGVNLKQLKQFRDALKINIPTKEAEYVTKTVFQTMEKLFSEFSNHFLNLQGEYIKLFSLIADDKFGSNTFAFCLLGDTDALLKWKSGVALKSLHLPRYIFVLPNNPINRFIYPAIDYEGVSIYPLGKYQLKGTFRDYNKNPFSYKANPFSYYVYFKNEKDLWEDWSWNSSYSKITRMFDSCRGDMLSCSNAYNVILHLYVKDDSVDEFLEIFADSLTRLSALNLS